MTTALKPKITVRWHHDLHGWAMECPRCGAMSVRDTQRGAFVVATDHLVAHARNTP